MGTGFSPYVKPIQINRGLSHRGVHFFKLTATDRRTAGCAALYLNLVFILLLACLSASNDATQLAPMRRITEALIISGAG